jgi:FkbM family methyltransferase
VTSPSSRSRPDRASLLNRLPWTRIKLGLVGLVYRSLRPFLGKAPRQIVRRGIRYRVDLSEAIDFAIFVAGNFQGYLTKSGLLSIPSEATVFDVGANMGSMTLAFAQRVTRGRVYAFEPTHSAYSRLLENLSLNPELASRVTPVKAFLSDRSSGEHGLSAFSSWKLDGSRADRHPLHGGTVESAEGVPAVSLDDFCRDRGIDRLDLLKIDTDGHELSVLRGAHRILGTLKPPVIFEVGTYLLEERGVRIEDYFDLLDPLGYRWINLKTGREVTRENAPAEVPARSTTDILALPKKA